MIRKVELAAAIVAATLVGCSAGSAGGGAASGAAVASRDAAVVNSSDHFADNGFGNAVAVIQHPAGEYRDGVTYVSYQGPLEDPYVAAYDHRAGTWRGPFKAGTSVLGKRAGAKIDNHGKPTLIIDQAGYIHVFFGGHGGRDDLHGKNPLGNPHDGENRHVVSKRPFDISEWERLDNIPPFGTYNQVVKMDNGDLYLFYRHGAHRSDWVYQKSVDNGRTFAAPVSFLKHLRRTDLKADDSWYPYVTKGADGQILVSFDYHLCWDNAGAPDKRGHTANRQDIYFMTFNTRDGTWRNVRGEPLPMPLTRADADQKALVARSDGLWTFNGSVTLDEAGHPHIGITMGRDVGERTGGPKTMRHFAWTGRAWSTGTDTGLPVAEGDLLVSGTKDVRFLLSSREAGRDGVVAWWESSDGGRHFVKSREWLRRPQAAFAISSIIRNAHPDAQVIVAEKAPGSDLRRMYLLGDSGPIKRIDAVRGERGTGW
jgi:hypothetical protein